MRAKRTLPVVLVVLVASLTALVGVPSAIAAGPADHLVFSQQPTNVKAGEAMSPAVTVDVVDIDGNLVTAPDFDVTLTLSDIGTGATLGGTTTQTSSAGEATFADLTVDKPGTGYTLTAAAATLTPDPVSTSFDVAPGDLASIIIAPHDATIQAGDSQDYTAEGFDGVGNDLGDVTGATTFTIEAGAGGSCTGATCTAAVVGDWTVTGDDGGFTDTATLHVTAGALDSITIAPSSVTIPAGGSQDYTAEGFDSEGNDLGDVTADTTFSIEAGSGGSCTGDTCTADVVGDWTVTGNDGGFTDTATLHVTGGALDSITIAPSSATITAGGSRTYTAEGFDSEGNDLGDVTADTTFSIEAGSGGSCTGDTCTADVVGDWTVTGNDGGFTDTAVLHVVAGSLDRIDIFPIGGGTVTAGESKTFRAEAYDSKGNDLGDVTPDTTFTIESGSGGSCAGAICTATVAGVWMVTGTYQGGAPTDRVSLHVEAAEAAKLAFGAQPTNTPAGTQLPNVTVEVEDTYGNLVTAAMPGVKIGLTIAHNPSGAHMTGGLPPHSIQDGVASFHNLVIDKPGTALTLRADPSVPGLTPALSDAFNSQGPTNVTLAASKHLSAYQQPVRLVAHLAACRDGCVLTVWRLPDHGVKSAVVRDRPVDSNRNVVLTVRPSANVTYWAEFTGDSRYLPDESNHVPVGVHVLVGSALHGYDVRFKGTYRLFHYHSACPQKHLGCPVLEGWVTPDKTDKRLHFILQAHVGGRWQSVAPPTVNTLHACAPKPVACASVIWIYAGPSVKNIPLRTRAWFNGDAYNEGFNGEWRYFKVI